MEESVMQDPPYRKKVYDLLKSNYSDFGRTEEEFYTKLDTDTGYAGKVHELLSKDFSDFKRPAEEFKSMISPATPLEKKKSWRFPSWLSRLTGYSSITFE